MAGAAKDLLAQKTPISFPEALRQLIQSERAERETRSILNRMKTAFAIGLEPMAPSIAHFPHHKDFASFDYTVTPVEQATIQELTTGQFTEKAQNLILVGGAGTGKIHIATALGTGLIKGGRKVRFFNTLDLINALIREDKEGRTGRLQKQLIAADCVIMDGEPSKAPPVQA